MHNSMRLRFQLTQHLRESINMSSIKYHAAIIPIALSISSFIYFLTTSAKVAIRLRLTTPSVEITVEIHPDKSSSGFNFLQDKPEVTKTL
jgi:hypothetical protein